MSVSVTGRQDSGDRGDSAGTSKEWSECVGRPHRPSPGWRPVPSAPGVPGAYPRVPSPDLGSPQSRARGRSRLRQSATWSATASLSPPTLAPKGDAGRASDCSRSETPLVPCPCAPAPRLQERRPGRSGPCRGAGTRGEMPGRGAGRRRGERSAGAARDGCGSGRRRDTGGGRRGADPRIIAVPRLDLHRS